MQLICDAMEEVGEGNLMNEAQDVEVRRSASSGKKLYETGYE